MKNLSLFLQQCIRQCMKHEYDQICVDMHNYHTNDSLFTEYVSALTKCTSSHLPTSTTSHAPSTGLTHQPAGICPASSVPRSSYLLLFFPPATVSTRFPASPATPSETGPLCAGASSTPPDERCPSNSPF